MPVTKQKVTLSIDMGVYASVRAILARMPGRPTASGIVEDLFRQFVGQVGPLLDEVGDDPSTAVRALTEFHGRNVRTSSVALDEVIRTIQAEEAGKE